MSRPSLLEGIGVALLASLSIGPLLAILRLSCGAIMAWKVTLVLLACAYIVYLLARRGRMAGRTTLVLGSLLVCLASLLMELRWPALAVVVTILVWAIRSYAYSPNLVSTMLHGGLCLSGVGAALWTSLQSRSVALTTWSFFLMQALFPLLPSRLGGQQGGQQAGGDDNVDAFVTAHQAAQKALQRLSMQTGGQESMGV